MFIITDIFNKGNTACFGVFKIISFWINSNPMRSLVYAPEAPMLSTKPCYELFSVAFDNFLRMCLIIERIYDDRTLQNVSTNLENLRKKANLKNANIY